jgi:signal transduction histidine kinase
MQSESHPIKVSAPEPIILMLDRPRIERVIMRVLDNAVRFSPDGGAIDAVVRGEAHDAVLSIRDHGIGIPSDRQQRIFEVFFRAHADSLHDRGGLGVGLYLAREIVRLHGGQMWFESVEGRGSTFHVQLPREVSR